MPTTELQHTFGRRLRAAVVSSNTGRISSGPDLRQPNQMAFYEELRERGYVDGQNLVVERRNAAKPDQLPAIARKLIALRPDLPRKRPEIFLSDCRLFPL